MKLDPKVVAELAVPFRPSAYLRVMPKLHATTPLGMGFGQTRFSPPDHSFKVLYIARDIATAIAETIIRCVSACKFDPVRLGIGVQL